MKNFLERIAGVERLLGAPLPSEYVELLRDGVPDLEEGRHGVPFRGELWDVNYLHELTSGPDYRQLDKTFAIVHDVLPVHMIPVALDHAGNFFGLFVNGTQRGEVVWWNHERAHGETHTEPVASSLSTFIASIRSIEDGE